MATFITHCPGNLAIETHVWTLSLDEAKSAISHLDCRPGTYWNEHLAKPYRRARRAKADHVRVYTGGFSTADLSNVLALSE